MLFLLSMFYFIFFLHIPLFSQKFVLASPPWKQVWFNWNFKVCRMVSVHGQLLFLAIWRTLLQVLGHQTFLTMANIRTSSKLFTALVAARPRCCHVTDNTFAAVEALMCAFLDWESLHLQHRQSFFWLKKCYNTVNIAQHNLHRFTWEPLKDCQLVSSSGYVIRQNTVSYDV